MLTHEEFMNLDGLSQVFLNTFRRMLPNVNHKEEVTDRLEVTVPAQSPDVGDIVARLDGDEVTISIGDYFHCHFSTFLQEGLSPAEAESEAAREAVEYIADFMADEVILRLHFTGGRFRMSETYHREVDVKPPAPEDREYVWSGPLRNQAA